MAATRVRLEENSYRLSWEEAEAFLSCHCLRLRERYDPFSESLKILFSYVRPGGTGMLSSCFLDIYSLFFFFLLNVCLFFKWSLLKKTLIQYY